MEAEGAFFNTSDFKLQPKIIGEGSYGKVFIAENVLDKKEYAAKLINVDHGFDGREQLLFLRESLTLHKLYHPAIVKFIGINFKSFSDTKLLQPTIITEYLRHGSLKENLNKEKNSLSDYDWSPTKKYINLIGISDALRYLHDQGIAHRDLKPENILVDSNYYPRVCDFGLSKCFPNSLSKSMKLTMTGEFGTPLYLPPEILRGDDSYDQSVDVYAFSMIAYEIVTGNQPFSELGENISPFKLINKIINGYRPNFPVFVTEKMKDLISKCWSDNPKERPTFEEIFNELSSDLSYFNESLDESEIHDYLDLLSDSSEERSLKLSKIQKSQHNNNEEVNNLKKEVEELKAKLAENKTEQAPIADTFLHYSFFSLFGQKSRRNIKRAINELELSSQKGNKYASFILGVFYETGVEVEKNYSKALAYYEESFKQGNPYAYNRLGENLPNDTDLAIEYFEKAAKLGEPAALSNIGYRYYCGKIGGKVDYSKALEYFEKAAELGEPTAISNIGTCYDFGHGVAKDCAKANQYYEKAANLHLPGAFTYLGKSYRDGDGVKQDYAKAREYFEKGGELGDKSSLYELGVLYRDGKGVKQDYTKAIDYYQKAAEFDYPNSFFSLGLLYRDGKGVKQDYAKAREYFEKASNLGVSGAFSNLGYLYEEGFGVKSDPSKAIEYYEKAANLGDYYAKERLKALGK